MIKLSVLMSVYKKENPKFLDIALKSIYDEQTKKPDEIILVKDGLLTDDLEKVINKWQNKLGDILKVVSIKENMGLANALNEGLKYCSGDFIARMDSDDISMPDRFQKQINFLLDNDIDMCSSSAILIDFNGNIIREKKVSSYITYESLLKSCDIIHPACMFKKDFFEKYGIYDTYFKKSQDYDLWLRASKNGAKIKNISEPLIKFRMSNNLIIRRKKEQKYNMLIKKKHIKGIKYYFSIIPNILVQSLPTNILEILIKVKRKK
jgi:glycosyltransferase involved in cell wall biosynthesis